MKKTLILTGMFLGLCTTLALTAPADGQLLPKNRVAQAPPPKFVPVPGAQPAADGKKLGPAACAVVRLELAKALRKKDHSLSWFQAVRKAQEVDDNTINALKVEAEKVVGQQFGALGDGTIIQAIIDFFKSALGQQLLNALIQLLLHLLGV